MNEKRCSLNACSRRQGVGTWVNVRVSIDATGQSITKTLPVCEEHWQALRGAR